MLTIERTVTKDQPPRPGSTFRSKERYTAMVDGVVVATAELGEAEVFERCPPEPFIAAISWTDGHRDAGRAVILAAADCVDATVHVHTNAAQHQTVAPRLALLADCGFELFQEKEGLWWVDDGRELPQPRLQIRSMVELGRAPFIELMESCMIGTLDRTDQLMIQRQGVRSWAAAFVDQHATVADKASWLIAANPAGAFVGFVGLVESDPAQHIGTVAMIGVLPGHRGLHHSDQLLHAAHLAARRRGLTAILSHTDVMNTPMLNAFARVGASTEGHPWHKWHHIKLSR